MNQEPEKRGFLFENLILAWSKLKRIRQLVDEIMKRKVYKDLPETIKDTLEEIKDTSQVRKEE